MDCVTRQIYNNSKNFHLPKYDTKLNNILRKDYNDYIREKEEINEIDSVDIFVNGAEVGDVPISYLVRNIMPYERPVIGMYVDVNIMPGFKYKVRKLADNNQFDSKAYIFDGEARHLLNIGTGYTKRFTFQGATLNNNKNYFWSDSNQPHGFGFSLEALAVGQSFIIHAPSQFNYATKNSILMETISNNLVDGPFAPPYEDDRHVNTNKNFQPLELVIKNQLVLNENDIKNVCEAIDEDACHNPIGQAIITGVHCDGDCREIKTTYISQSSRAPNKVEKWVPIKFSCFVNFSQNPMRKFPLKQSEFTFKGVAVIVKEGGNNSMADTRRIHNIFIPNFGKCVLVRA